MKSRLTLVVGGLLLSSSLVFAVECPPGMTMSPSGACVRVIGPQQCPPGQKLVASPVQLQIPDAPLNVMCVLDPNNYIPPQSCPAGQAWNPQIQACI